MHPHRAIQDPHGAGLRERNKREKLERITQAAAELFREQGFEGTTGRQICARANVGTGTLFLYVKDKRELLSLIFEPLAEKVFGRINRGLRKNELLVDGLMRLFGAFFRLYANDLALSRLFVQDLLFRGDDYPGLQRLQDELQQHVFSLVRESQDRGDLRTDIAAETLVTAFLAHYVLWTQLWLGSGETNRRSASRGLRSALQIQVDGAGRKG